MTSRPSIKRPVKQPISRVSLATVLPLLLLLFVALFSPCSQGVVSRAADNANSTVVAPSPPKPYSRHASSAAQKWADKELQHMSLDEKIGQLISVGVNATFLNQ